ncbi:MAG: ABC transporter ATP-binding protein [Candidatus Saganbacteria bacterium]|nr:ABC transporter ATP-binding protein [Candidatus Saganbacteria bacterium]
MNLYFRLLKYLKPYWLEITGAVVSMFIVSACNVAIIPLVGKFSQAISSKDFFVLNLAILGAVIAYFIKGLFTYAQLYLMSFSAQRVCTDLQIQIYKHLQDMSLDFFAKWHTGDMISRVLGDITTIKNSTVNVVTEFFPSVVTLIGVLSYLLYLNWRLTIIALIVLPVLAFTITKFGEEMRKVAKAARINAAQLTQILQETLSGASVVKSFTMEKHEVKRFTEQTEQGFHLSMKEGQIDATHKPVVNFLQVLAMVAVIWYGGYEVVTGGLNPNNLIAFFVGIGLIAEPVMTLSKINLIIQRALTAAERVFEVIDIAPTVKDMPDAKEIPHIKGKIDFRNVSFHYNKEEGDVLKNINLEVSPGEIIALVGPSGAGKSTFVSLISRFYDPSEGAIYVDGHNIKEVTLFSLRRQIGIVPQETILFSGLIKDNIAYGKIDAQDKEIIAAAKMANAHDFIAGFPEGYDTKVGERGVRLSGGEKQRIAIARAILRNPKILILDEATSSLDSESERSVQAAMDRLMVGRTTFVIAHRLSTIQDANRIIVINKGEIVEEGRHEELLARGGLYKKLYDIQFRDEEV